MKKVLYTFFALLALTVAIGVGVYYYRAAQNKPMGVPQSDQAIAKELLEKLSSHILLPSETPTIGIVTDIEKLRLKSNFFINAKNGDKLFIYHDKAIIFDVIADKLINVGPITKPQKSSSAEAEIQPK